MSLCPTSPEVASPLAWQAGKCTESSSEAHPSACQASHRLHFAVSECRPCPHEPNQRVVLPSTTGLGSLRSVSYTIGNIASARVLRHHQSKWTLSGVTGECIIRSAMCLSG